PKRSAVRNTPTLAQQGTRPKNKISYQTCHNDNEPFISNNVKISSSPTIFNLSSKKPKKFL
ncbi:MAG: hypothetical protein RML94_06120, partial [Bacteroidia bacterium]|nr:hypothetical protein [Bacteroidia bacterium]